MQATTTVDGETLTSQEFPVPAQRRRPRRADRRNRGGGGEGESRGRSGGETTGAPGVVEIGPESRIIIEYQDDNLTVFYLLEVLNNARTPIDIGGPLLIRVADRRRGRVDHAGLVAKRQRARATW